jgi:hypothetical protein
MPGTQEGTMKFDDPEIPEGVEVENYHRLIHPKKVGKKKPLKVVSLKK